MGTVAQIDTVTGKALDQLSTNQAAHTNDQSVRPGEDANLDVVRVVPAQIPYLQLTASAYVKNAPGNLSHLTCVASSSGSLTLYDNPDAASGTVLFSKALSAGDVIDFKGGSFALGLYAEITNTLTVNIWFA